MQTRDLVKTLQAGPPTLDVTPTAEHLGVSRAALYEAIKRGDAPVATIRVGSRIKVLTASVIEVLRCGDGPAVTSGETAPDSGRSEGQCSRCTTSAVKRDGERDRGSAA